MDYDTRRCLERRISLHQANGWRWTVLGIGTLPPADEPGLRSADLARAAAVAWLDEHRPDLVALATERARYINGLFGPLTEDTDP